MLAVDVWSHWSLTRALGSPEDIITSAGQQGYSSVLMADYNSLAGILAAQDAAENTGITVLAGVTVPLATRGSVVPVKVVGAGREAWSRLCKIASAGDTPRDIGDVLSGDLALVFPPDFNEGSDTWWRALDAKSAGVFRWVRPDSSPADSRGGPPVVASVPIRYPDPADREAWDVLAAIGGTGRGPGTAWMSAEGLRQAFVAWPEAIRNLERLEELGQHFRPPERTPHLPEWPGSGESSPALELARWARTGLHQRLHGSGLDPAPYQDRLDQELHVIIQLGFQSYFLIVADLVRDAKRRGIWVGPGRGSAAGSLVAWALGITALDPIRWGLVFERFLNPSRATLPDIDLDIEDTRRYELVEYLQERYGAERVAQIGTYGTLGARAALRDTARVLALDSHYVDRVVSLVPKEPHITLADAEAMVPALKQLTQAPEMTVWWRVARRLEGTPRHASVHAAGVVVAPDSVNRWSPILTAGAQRVTQLGMHEVERLGLLKLDLLGLRTLSVLKTATGAVSDTLPALDAVPPDDPRTLRLLSRAETDAVFQLDGRGVKELLRQLKPRHLADVMVVVALYRPGPMDHIGEYLRRRQGPWAPYDELTKLLAETFGVLVYQEQLMAVVRELGGYSWAEADLFRRAVSKKDRVLLDSEQDRFLAASIGRGRTQAEAKRIWTQIESFADYGFNKAHAAAYGLLAYYLAYIKAHWPYAFWIGELSTVVGDRLGRDVWAAYREGVTVGRPDVNVSGVAPVYVTDAEQNMIVLGLSAIRGIGDLQASDIIAARGSVRFRDAQDFIERVGRRIPDKAFEQLVLAGALDRLGSAEDFWRRTAPASQQLSWLEEGEPAHPAALPDPPERDRLAYGWVWPIVDGRVYIRVADEKHPSVGTLHEWARQHPGRFEVVVATGNSRSGHSLQGVRVAGDVHTLRALGDLEGVVSVSKGLTDREGL